jgi:CheY-like chemotaxis protein
MIAKPGDIDLRIHGHAYICNMEAPPIRLLLADDDADDRMFFKDALEELPVSSLLNSVNNGDQLMKLLKNESTTLPDILFLDLNMPRKTGFECLDEIKRNEKLKSLQVIIYSTSLDHEVVNLLYEKGAHRYIRKPGDFSSLKKVIHEAIITVLQNSKSQSGKENFVIQI